MSLLPPLKVKQNLERRTLLLSKPLEINFLSRLRQLRDVSSLRFLKTVTTNRRRMYRVSFSTHVKSLTSWKDSKIRLPLLKLSAKIYAQQVSKLIFF
jgi:hypothetical protein